MNQPLLLDATLIPDPLADGELGPGEAQTISDTDVKSARIQLVQTALERIDIDGEASLALALAAVFHTPSACVPSGPYPKTRTPARGSATAPISH